ARGHIDRGAEALVELEALAARPREPSRERRSMAPRWKVERLALDDVGVVSRRLARTTFAAEPGENAAIVGPTGSGKTTLLRGLLGLEATSGRVRYGDEAIERRGVGPLERPFAWVPQEPAIVAGSVEDNIALGAGAVDEAAARSALETIGARSLLERGK